MELFADGPRVEVADRIIVRGPGDLRAPFWMASNVATPAAKASGASAIHTMAMYQSQTGAGRSAGRGVQRVNRNGRPSRHY